MVEVTREILRTHFMQQNGWGEAEVYPLKADASFRRYFRLKQKNKKIMLMDAPPEFETLTSFVNIARHLKRLGFSAPRLAAKDEVNGFMLLEDFGDATFTNLDSC